MNAETEAYFNGKQARDKGTKLSDCPYQIARPRREWQEGWLARDILLKRAEREAVQKG